MKTKQVIFFMLSSAFTVGAVSATPTSLFPLFGGKTVKVYVADVKDSTDTHEVDALSVKTKLQEALKGRKSIHFEVVEKPQDAEISIEAELKGFLWTDHDPVDMLMGAGMAAMDAATIEDFASVEADIAVSDARTNKILWQDRVRASITKKPMSRGESISLVSGSLAKEFIKECFSKKRQ